MRRFLKYMLIATMLIPLSASANTFNQGEKQILVDGDMEKVGVGDWTAANSAALTKETINPYRGTQILRVTRNGVDNPSAYQTILTVGKTYRITGWARAGGGVAEYPRIYNSPPYIWTGTTSTDWQRFDITWVATNAQLRFYASNSAGVEYCEFDDILVTEYHAPSKNAESQILIDGDMEKVGVGDWGGSHSVRTKESGAVDDGAQVLRVTADAVAGTRFPQATQTVLVVDDNYRVTGWVRSDGTETPWVFNAPNTLWTGVNTHTNWQYFDETFTAENTSLSFVFTTVDPAGTEYVEWDNILVTKYTPPVKNFYSQLLIDGDMEKAGVADWTPLNAGVLTKESTDPHNGERNIKIAWSAGANSGAGQDILTVGKGYRVTGWARGDGVAAGAIPRIRLGLASVYYGTNSNVWQRIDVTGIADAISFKLYSNLTGAGYVEFDDIFVTEIP